MYKPTCNSHTCLIINDYIMYDLELGQHSELIPQIDYSLQNAQQSLPHMHEQPEGERLKVGLLRANWHHPNGLLYCFNYGTAFLVGPDLIVTCAHNIFADRVRAYATSCIFIPGHSGATNSKTKKYKTVEGPFYHCTKVETSGAFHQKPIPQQLCLIQLSEPVPASSFFKIGHIEPILYRQLSLIGYPSVQYAAQLQLGRLNMKRQQLEGKLFLVEGCTIHHTMPTKQGHSGSPIIAKTKQGTSVVVGIHTHRGKKDINKGLFFNEKILEDLNKLERQITYHTNHKSIVLIKESEQQDDQNDAQSRKITLKIPPVKQYLESLKLQQRRQAEYLSNCQYQPESFESQCEVIKVNFDLKNGSRMSIASYI